MVFLATIVAVNKMDIDAKVAKNWSKMIVMKARIKALSKGLGTIRMLVVIEMVRRAKMLVVDNVKIVLVVKVMASVERKLMELFYLKFVMRKTT